MPTDRTQQLLLNIAAALQVAPYDVSAVVSILLVTTVSGLVSPLVVGSRMAFFSDAMAHTAFAGAAFGVLAVLTVAGPAGADSIAWIVPVCMVGFGAAAGVAVAFFRERSGLSADSVIGVFFALAIGFAAVVIPEVSKRVRFDAEQFLFGSPLYASGNDIFGLMLVLAVVVLFLLTRFNGLVFASFNSTMARSRGFATRANTYAFVVLLSLVVNLSIQSVGVLLINALLVVPGAAAANVSRDLRSMFRNSLAASVGLGMVGYLLSRHYQLNLGGQTIPLRPGGTIVMLVVGWFFVSVLVARLRGRSQLAGLDCEC